MTLYQFIPVSKGGCNSVRSEAEGGYAIALIGVGNAIALLTSMLCNLLMDGCLNVVIEVRVINSCNDWAR
ncbi:MAG TPA: hypothetical protein V6C95_22060 [Coleofasciculaceae cyanobacterium]